MGLQLWLAWKPAYTGGPRDRVCETIGLEYKGDTQACKAKLKTLSGNLLSSVRSVGENQLYYRWTKGQLSTNLNFKEQSLPKRYSASP